MDWLILEAAGTYQETFHSGQSDLSAYNSGRRSVGLAVLKLIQLKPELFK